MPRRKENAEVTATQIITTQAHAPGLLVTHLYVAHCLKRREHQHEPPAEDHHIQKGPVDDHGGGVSRARRVQMKQRDLLGCDSRFARVSRCQITRASVRLR